MTAYGASRVDAEGTTHAQRFVVVLNQTQDVVNIATAVRAMMNMGLRRLRLVAPVDYNAHRVAGIAHGSESVLENIEFFGTLEDALADTSFAIGTTARRRTASFVWQHPRDAAAEMVQIAQDRAALGPVAIVFGREDKGLSNEDLDRCDRLLVIPTDPSYSSLNLAQAVLLITYELWLASGMNEESLPLPKRTSEPATPRQIADLFTDSHDTLETIDFFKKRKPEAIMRTVRAVFRRAELNAREATLFRAIMIEVRKHAARVAANAQTGNREDGGD